MMNRYEDCHCEDFPCCGHYDILYGDENQPEYCDMCGGYHSSAMNCQYDDDDEDDEDAIAMRDPETEHDRDYNYRNPVLDLIEAAEEYDRDLGLTEELHD